MPRWLAAAQQAEGRAAMGWIVGLMATADHLLMSRLTLGRGLVGAGAGAVSTGLGEVPRYASTAKSRGTCEAPARVPPLADGFLAPQRSGGQC